MKFGEKVRRLRNEKGLSQTELGKLCGLSLRTIRNYEVDGRYPKQREVYSKLAAALGCDVNYLLSENEEFVLQAKQTYGYQGARDAEELIADISHQTRTPLSNILLYTELLEEEPLGEAAQDSVKKLRQQSEKLQFLIDALVKLSRLETGVFVLHPKRQPLTELVIDCMESYREKAAAQGLSIAFAGTKKAEEDAPVYAYFDKKWSMEAMGNILDNAIKYTNTGGITIKLCSYELFACVEVTDTGIGIGEEEHAAVFRRFYRGNAVAEKSGVGIGLYLARSIMQQQDGYIRLSSTPGEGSTFGLYFPTAIVSKL